MVEQPLLQDALGAEFAPAVDERHPAGEGGEEQRFLHRRIAAADNRDRLAAIEEAVAGGARRDAEPAQRFLARQPKPFRLRAGGDDQRFGEDHLAAVELQPERPVREVRLNHHVGHDLASHVLGLSAHLLHQPRPLNNVGETWIVLDVGRDRQLAAGLHAGEQHRLEQRARRIDRGGVAGGTGADDRDADGTRLRHGRLRR